MVAEWKSPAMVGGEKGCSARGRKWAIRERRNSAAMEQELSNPWALSLEAIRQRVWGFMAKSHLVTDKNLQPWW